MGFIKDFKTFAMKGNLADLAIGVVIGAAFGKVISAFVDGLVMPLVGIITGGVDFSKMAYELSPAQLDAAGKVVKEANTFKYGAFITAVIDFLIVALVCYLVIKNLMKKDPNAAPAPTATESLLTEIRDSLKK